MQNTANQKLIRGRVGDLTDTANPLTFSLIQKIFGFQGPYRKVLSQFGIGDTPNPTDYLILKDGTIYSDIEKENEILWKPTGYKLIQIRNQTQTKVSLLNKYFPSNTLRLAKKTLNDIRIIQNPNDYITRCFRHYQNINSLLEKNQKTAQITPDELLNNYENVIYISYINEVLLSYFKFSPQIYQNQCVIDYLDRYEAILASPDTFYEQTFNQFGFTLGELPISNITNLPLIPDSFPLLISNQSSVNYIITQQCIRNNTRLKINALLYFLNSYLFNKCNQNPDFGYLTIGEIEAFTNYSKAEIDLIITNRKQSLANQIQQTSNQQPVTKLIGIPCSIGVVTGKLQIVNQPNEEILCDIVVFPNASPTFTQQFKKAKGLIFRIGSPLSHGSIVAREMQIPAIVVDHDFSQFNNRICTINGSTGELKLE